MAFATTLQLPPLGKKSMSELVAKAKRLGIAPGDYAKSLIEDALAFQRVAEETSLAEIMQPVREAAGEVDDAEVLKLVETARTKHHANGRRKKR